MKKYILLIVALSFSSLLTAQTKGVRIAYIDMEYILEKVPSYAEAKNQLEEKAQKWKLEIEEKKVEISKMKETLKSEKVLLTKELLEEREEEIAYLETELLDYQQKRFGPNGDLMSQKAVLVKPIQDQVFNTVQDLAEGKYDFVFDRSSDLTMLFSNKRFDISDRVVRALVRAERKDQISKKQLQAEAEADKKADMLQDNPELVEREKSKEEKKLARQKLIDENRAAAEEKKKAFEEKRKQMLEEKLNKKNGTVSDNTKTATDKTAEKSKLTEELAEKKAKAEEDRKKSLEERNKIIEEKKKLAEEKRLKILADREAAKKAREEELKNKKTEQKP